jgi:predicted O-methyltransferase YrrM
MNSTRTVSLVAFVVGSAGLSLLLLGESTIPVIGGALLTSAAAIYLTRHFWRETGRRGDRTANAQMRAMAAGMSKFRADLHSASESLSNQTDDVSNRVTAFSKGILEYVSQLELDLDAVTSDLEKVSTRLDKMTSRLDGMTGDVKSVGDSIRKTRDLADQKAQRYRDEVLTQVSGVVGIYQVLQPRVPYPTFGGWAIDGGSARHFISKILTDRPQVIVEMGSGLSTILAAQAMDVIGIEGQVISLEHDESWAEHARSMVEQHGVAHRCRVVHAPLVDTIVDGESYKWYDLTKAELPEQIELVLVDGPPKSTGPLARYPAIPLLYDSLRIGATVLIDDAARPDEREALARWAEMYPDLSVTFVEGSKGLAEIVKGAE